MAVEAGVRAFRNVIVRSRQSALGAPAGTAISTGNSVTFSGNRGIRLSGSVSCFFRTMEKDNRLANKVFCDYCESFVGRSTYYRHRARYYDQRARQWISDSE